MAASKHSMLVQRALRAENALRAAEIENERMRAAVQELRASLQRHVAADALAATLSPTTRVPHTGATIQLVNVRSAVYTESGYRCPYTGEVFEPTRHTYWRPTEE